MVPEPVEGVEGPTLGLFVRPFVRTTRYSQILCQGQKWVKIANFTDKISDYYILLAVLYDKISETYLVFPFFSEKEPHLYSL